MLKTTGNKVWNTQINDHKKNQDALSGLGNDDSSADIGGDIKNLLTVAKLTKFKKPNLAKFKKLELAKAKKLDFVSANSFETDVLITKAKKTFNTSTKSFYYGSNS